MNVVSRLAGEEEVVTVFKSTGLQFTDIQDDKSWEESLIDEEEDDDGNGHSADEGVDLLCGSGSVTSQGSVTVENDLNGSFYVRSLGLDDICFDGEIGYWKASLVNSPMVKAVERSTEMGTHEDKKVGFHGIVTFVDNSKPLEVPEEYDRFLYSLMDSFNGKHVRWEAQGVG